MVDLHDQTVRLLYDIIDVEDNVLAKAGTEFVWDDDTDHQYVDGKVLYVEPDEVEIVN